MFKINYHPILGMQYYFEPIGTKRENRRKFNKR